MKLSEQIRQFSPYSSPEKGCGQLLFGVFVSTLLAVIVPLVQGKFDWRFMPIDILSYMGSYWLVLTILIAIVDKRKKNVE